jgi:hypothetical protein
VEYRVEFDDDRPAEVGRFPDRNEQFPRLLYHRHLMLAERTYEAYPGALSPLAPPDVRRAWEARRQEAQGNYDLLRASLERRLLAQPHARSVTIVRLERELLTPDQLLSPAPGAPRRMDDERLLWDVDNPPAQNAPPAPDLEPLE